MGIQLTLNPIRGFGILLQDAGSGDELAIDYRTGLPYFTRVKRTAKQARVFFAPAWGNPQVVAVEKHEGDDVPTYVIGEVIR